MATAVQIEIRVDDAGVSSGINKIGASLKELQAQAAQAAKNLADAQLQLGKAAEQGNAQARAAIEQYQLELVQAEAQLTAFKAATAGAAEETEKLKEAVSKQVPQFIAAGGALNVLEGHTTNLNRSAARFLSTTLGLGPALQAAFPVIGALAFLSVIEQLATKTSQWFADTFIFTAGMKAAYQGQIDANNALVAAREHLSQVEADLFKTTHTAAQNFAFDIDSETAKRNGLIDTLSRQRARVDELTQAEKQAETALGKARAAQGSLEYGGAALGMSAPDVKAAETAVSVAKQQMETAKVIFQALQIEVDAANAGIDTSFAKMTEAEQKAAEEARKARRGAGKSFREGPSLRHGDVQ